jgi:flagellum-specific peptidoglycan hydrolase FlgJ
MTPVPRDQQERFLRQIVPAAAQVCPQFGLDPKACIMAAALQSSCGRFALGFNWWSLHGNGDAGHLTLMRPVRTLDGTGGGWVGQEDRIAKFSSPHAAVVAWCIAAKGAACSG